MATAKHLDDITECPICTEVYTDPRVLPCGHTICLKCIRDCSRDKQPGDKLACPLCRKELTLPSNGAEDLPKKFLGTKYLKELSGVDKVATGVDKCRKMLAKIEQEVNDFTEQITKAEMEISKKAEQLKQMIDVHREKLMTELSSEKQKRMKEIESLREDIERQLLSMESYQKYVGEVRQRGTACDVAREASGLHSRAEELLKFDVLERTLGDLGQADVTFTSSDFVIDDVNKTFGQLRHTGSIN